MKGDVSSPFGSEREEGAYVTTIRQDSPNAPMYVDPVMFSRSDLFATRL